MGDKISYLHCSIIIQVGAVYIKKTNICQLVFCDLIYE